MLAYSAAVCPELCILQVHSLLRHWQQQAASISSGCRSYRRQLQQDHSQQPAAQLKQLIRASKPASQRLFTIACASAPLDDNSVVAGIPVSAANTTAGHSLWQTLQHEQLQFVSEVSKCLEDLAAQGVPSDQQGAEEGILVSTRRKALLEDVLYLWAVAEAYLSDASLQASFR